MEIYRGKHASFMDARLLVEQLAGYEHIHIDIGTGDGRFVRHMAAARPQHFVIGVDACRENLEETARRAPANSLFVIANAQALPPELHGLAASVTVNFPWGSLLEGLLEVNSQVLAGVKAITRPRAQLEVRLNSGALAEIGISLEVGAEQVRHALTASGFNMQPPVELTAVDLRAIPTTWAKRLAYGRDPRGVSLTGGKRQF
ncbi:MAG: class I SAM-dependent methyltransferase [Anaerolineae bacterium]